MLDPARDMHVRPSPEFGVEYHCRTIEDPHVVVIGAVGMPTEVVARLHGQHARHRRIGAPQHPVGDALEGTDWLDWEGRDRIARARPVAMSSSVPCPSLWS